MLQQAMQQSMNMSYQSAAIITDQTIKPAMPLLVCNECQMAPCKHFPGAADPTLKDPS